MGVLENSPQHPNPRLLLGLLGGVLAPFPDHPTDAPEPAYRLAGSGILVTVRWLLRFQRSLPLLV